jgi:tRNA(Ile)-lysidine synthase
MLHLLSTIWEKNNLCVAHVDHGLRAESAEDAHFVNEQAKKLGLHFSSTRLTVKSQKENQEAWARNQRYAFLEQVRQETESQWILTAHHQGDFRETFLMKKLAGKRTRNIELRCEKRKLIRPFLSCEPSMLEEFAQDSLITYREDSSNWDKSFFRNAIRHELLPFLVSRFGQCVEKLLSALAQDSAVWIAANEARLQNELAPILSLPFGSQTQKKALVALCKALHSPSDLELLSLFLHPILHYRLSLDRAHDCLQVLNHKAQACVLPGAWELRLKSGGFRLEKVS